MGEVRARRPVKYMASLLTGDPTLLPEVKTVLVEELGALDFVSPALPFNDTTYYEDEFGPNLQREIITFKELRDMADLGAVKVLTNELEQRWAVAGSRKVNIDPGYIALGKFVLATTKDQSHRLYIGKGIFAEVTLRYRKKSFAVWEWTYPDYATPQYIALFNQLRQAYRMQLKAEGHQGY